MQPTASADQSAAEIVFVPKDRTKLTFPIMALTAVFGLCVTWGNIRDGDAVAIAVVVGLVALVGGVFYSAARNSARRRIAISGRTVSCISGKNSVPVDLGTVTDLARRRVKMGKSSYVGYFLVQDEKETLLFTDGAYPDQEPILQVIAERSGRTWENQ
jgi:hypothetical protein